MSKSCIIFILYYFYINIIEIFFVNNVVNKFSVLTENDQ